MKAVRLLPLLACLWALPAWAGGDPAREWEAFKAAFMSGDGRIIDWQNDQRSHSEGQGYAMTLAVFMNDRPAFERAFTWSENNLGHGLRAWSWGRSRNETGEHWGILSANNATDGDMLHAWALLLAGEKWRDEAFAKTGSDLLARLRQELIAAGGIILPGREGFIDASGVATVNPAYYIFPALKDFRRFDAEHAVLWDEVYQRGLELIRKSADTRSGTVPDWLRYDVRGDAGGALLPPQDDDRFSYEAIRVPLYLSMSGETPTLAAMRPLIRRAAREGFLAEALRLDGTAASQGEILAGGYATLARAASALGMSTEANALWELAGKRKPAQKDNYYGSVLFLFALLEPAGADDLSGRRRSGRESTHDAR